MRAEVILYQSTAAWHFINLPKHRSKEIRKKFGRSERGWGSLPVEVTIGKTTWRTSIFYDTKAGTYLLPLKAQVRKKEDIWAGDKVSFSITLRP
jgi:hypothetical protein